VASHPFLTTNLFLFLALSRLGLWMHNLVVQTLVQIEIGSNSRVWRWRSRVQRLHAGVALPCGLSRRGLKMWLRLVRS
jgi:hypothetical protein